MEVFGRGPDFDPAVDAIVRVDAGRLRARLRDYYEGEGRNDPLRIDIPKGGYALVCRPRQEGRFLAPAAVPVLVLLPLADLDRGSGEDYLAERFADALSHELSTFAGLQVISRLSSLAYWRKHKSAGEIARELGADYLVAGSLQRAAYRLRVTVQLVDAHTDTQLWSERLDSTMEDIFTLQDEFARGVARGLQTRLVPPITSVTVSGA